MNEKDVDNEETPARRERSEEDEASSTRCVTLNRRAHKRTATRRMLLESIGRMRGSRFGGQRRWPHHILLVIWIWVLVSRPVVGYFLGDTKAVLKDCVDHWTLQNWAAFPVLHMMTVCVDIRMMAPGPWVAFSYSSVHALTPDLGLEGDENALYIWLLRVRHSIPFQLSPKYWHTICLRRDVRGHSFSLEIDGRMVAERMVTSQAIIPPDGSLWLGCRPRDKLPGTTLGEVELYLFRVWADLHHHALCEDGTEIGWRSEIWGVTSPHARQTDASLKCDFRWLRRRVRDNRSFNNVTVSARDSAANRTSEPPTASPSANRSTDRTNNGTLANATMAPFTSTSDTKSNSKSEPPTASPSANRSTDHIPPSLHSSPMPTNGTPPTTLTPPTTVSQHIVNSTNDGTLANGTMTPFTSTGHTKSKSTPELPTASPSANRSTDHIPPSPHSSPMPTNGTPPTTATPPTAVSQHIVNSTNDGTLANATVTPFTSNRDTSANSTPEPPTASPSANRSTDHIPPSPHTSPMPTNGTPPTTVTPPTAVTTRTVNSTNDGTFVNATATPFPAVSATSANSYSPAVSLRNGEHTSTTDAPSVTASATPPTKASPGDQFTTSSQTSVMRTTTNSTPPTLRTGTPLKICNVARICSNTSAYFWTSISVQVKGRNKTEKDVSTFVSKAFACDDDDNRDIIDFCQGGRRLQKTKVSCSVKDNISNTNCSIVLQLSHAMATCELRHTAMSALQKADDGQITASLTGYVERVASQSECGSAETSSGGFLRCTSPSSLEDICQSKTPSTVKCSLLELSSTSTPQLNTGSCGWPRFCSCTAFCDSANRFFAVKIRIGRHDFKVNTLQTLLSNALLCQNNLKLFILNVKGHNRGYHTFLCRPWYTDAGFCTVIVEMSKNVDGCSLANYIQQIINSTGNVTSEGSLTPLVICGQPELSVSNLLNSNLTWVDKNLLFSDVCNSEQSLFKCEDKKTRAVVLTDSCPKPVTTTPSTPQPSTLANNDPTATAKVPTPSPTNTTHQTHATSRAAATATPPLAVFNNTSTAQPVLHTSSGNTTVTATTQDNTTQFGLTAINSTLSSATTSAQHLALQSTTTTQTNIPTTSPTNTTVYNVTATTGNRQLHNSTSTTNATISAMTVSPNSTTVNIVPTTGMKLHSTTSNPMLSTVTQSPENTTPDSATTTTAERHNSSATTHNTTFNTFTPSPNVPTEFNITTVTQQSVSNTTFNTFTPSPIVPTEYNITTVTQQSVSNTTFSTSTSFPNNVTTAAITTKGHNITTTSNTTASTFTLFPNETTTTSNITTTTDPLQSNTTFSTSAPLLNNRTLHNLTTVASTSNPQNITTTSNTTVRTSTLFPNGTTSNITTTTDPLQSNTTFSTSAPLPNNRTLHNLTTVASTSNPQNITTTSNTTVSTSTLFPNETTSNITTTTDPLQSNTTFSTSAPLPNNRTLHNLTTVASTSNPQNITTTSNTTVSTSTLFPNETTSNITTTTDPLQSNTTFSTSAPLPNNRTLHNLTTVASTSNPQNITTTSNTTVSTSTLFPNGTTSNITTTTDPLQSNTTFSTSAPLPNNRTLHNLTTVASTSNPQNITTTSNTTVSTSTLFPNETTSNITTTTDPLQSNTTFSTFTPSPNITTIEGITGTTVDPNTTVSDNATSTVTSETQHTTVSSNVTTVLATATQVSQTFSTATTSPDNATVTPAPLTNHTRQDAAVSVTTIRAINNNASSSSAAATSMTPSTGLGETAATSSTVPSTNNNNINNQTTEGTDSASTTAAAENTVSGQTAGATSTTAATDGPLPSQSHPATDENSLITTTPQKTTSTSQTTTKNSQTELEAQLDEILALTQDASRLTSSEVEQLVGQLEKLLENPPISREVGQKIIDIVNNLLSADRSVLASTSNRIIRLVEDLAVKLAVTGSRARRDSTGGAVVLSADSLVLAVQPVDETNFPTTSVNIFDTDDVQIRRFPRLQRRSARFPLASAVLPSSLTDGLSPEEKLQASRVQFTFYDNNILFTDEELNNQTVASSVLSVSVANLSIKDVSENIEFTIRSNNSENYEASCVFWNFTLNGGRGGWSSDGCFVLNTTLSDTTCSCNHLTAFAILLDLSRGGISDRTQALILTFITYIGCGISAIFLAFTLLTYLCFPKLLRDIPAKILVQLCLSLLFLNLVFLLDGWLALYPATGLCISTAFFLHYFLLTTFTWVGLEALHMYLSIVRVFTSYITRYMLKFSLVGWGVPLIVVIIVISVDKDNYGLVTYGRYTDGTSDDFCWLRNDIAFYVGLVAYFLAIFAMCLLVFVIVLVQVYRIKRQNPHNQSSNRGVMADMRSICGLIVLLGLTWGFALFAWGPLYLPFVYLFSIFNSLQGFFIFVFHCAVKENVRRQWRMHLCCGKLWLAENSDWSRTATQNRKNQSTKTTPVSVPIITSRSSSFTSDGTNSSGSVFADSGISEGSNSDVVLNELHQRNMAE